MASLSRAATGARAIRWVAFALVLCAWGCGLFRPGPPRAVVLVLIDTLRADHVGSYGYSRDTTPFLDELASQGILFENAVSSAPATFPAVNSLLTSRDAGAFYRSSSHDLGIPEELTTLAEVFREHGFRTAAVSASPIVRRSPSKLNPSGGFGQGFDHFDERCSSRGARIRPHSVECVTRRAKSALKDFGDDPFFLYVHYLDPHDLYRAPSDEGGWVSPYEGKGFIANGDTWPVRRWLDGFAPDPQIDDRDLRHLIDLYDAEIRSLDSGLRTLLEGFEARGRLEDTLFVFASDHGESFMEKDFIEHGNSLFQTELHVPLIFYRANDPRDAVRYREPVCGVDLMPTILAQVGLAVPEGLRGVDLLGADGEQARADRSCLSEHRFDWNSPRARLAALRRGDQKLIYDSEMDAYGHFDLGADPAETANLAATRRPPYGALVEELRSRWPSMGGFEVSQPVELDPEAERALKSLGYIE